LEKEDALILTARGKDMPIVITVGIIILGVTVVACAGLVAIPLWPALFSR
jgi:hypothetical protein